MSQLDFVIYNPFLLLISISFIIVHSIVYDILAVSTYALGRVRSLFVQGLGASVFEGAGRFYLIKKFFSSKLFTYRTNEYYNYLRKKLK